MLIVCISNKLFYPQVWVVLIIKEKFVEQIYIFGGSVIWPERVETYPLQETRYQSTKSKSKLNSPYK